MANIRPPTLRITPASSSIGATSSLAPFPSASSISTAPAAAGKPSNQPSSSGFSSNAAPKITPLLDWEFLKTRSSPRPTDGRPVVMPHLHRLVKQSKQHLLQQLNLPNATQQPSSAVGGLHGASSALQPLRTPPSLLDAEESLINNELLLSSTSLAGMYPITQRYHKALATMKREGLFDDSAPFTSTAGGVAFGSGDASTHPQLDQYAKSSTSLNAKHSELYPPAYRFLPSSSQFQLDFNHWRFLRGNYNRMAASLIEDSIADNFRVGACRAFDKDCSEWEKEKLRLMQVLEASRTNAGQSFVVSEGGRRFRDGRKETSHQLSGGLNRWNKARNAGETSFSAFKSSEDKHSFVDFKSFFGGMSSRAGQEHRRDRLNDYSQAANQVGAIGPEEVKVLQWLYTDEDSDYAAVDIDAFLREVVSSSSLGLDVDYRSWIELRDVWQHVICFGEMIRGGMTSKRWLLQVISSFEKLSMNNMTENLRNVSKYSAGPGFSYLEGLQQVMASVEYSDNHDISRGSHAWFWMLAYTALRSGDLKALAELSGSISSNLLSLENAPPEFSTVCRALGHISYTLTLSSLEISANVSSFAAFDSFKNPDLIGDAVLSRLVLQYPTTDSSGGPVLRLLLSLINPRVWSEVSISESLLRTATQEDYVWYTFRILLSYETLYGGDENMMTYGISDLAARFRSLGPTFFALDKTETVELAQNATHFFQLRYGRMLIYCGYIESASLWIAHENEALERIMAILMIYLVKCGNYYAEQNDGITFSKQEVYSETMKKLLLSSLDRKVDIITKFLYLKTLPKANKLSIYLSLISKDYDGLSTDRIIGYISIPDERFVEGFLPDLVLDDKIDSDTTKAMLSSIYEFIATKAISEDDLTVALRCLYILDDKNQYFEVLGEALSDKRFDCFSVKAVQDTPLLRDYLYYYLIAVAKWRETKDMKALTSRYLRCCFYYSVCTGDFFEALEIFKNFGLLQQDDPSMQSAMAEPNVTVNKIAAYAYCLAELLAQGKTEVEIVPYTSLSQLQSAVKILDSLQLTLKEKPRIAAFMEVLLQLIECTLASSNTL